MSDASNEPIRCPDCGATNYGATNARCWLCGRDLAVAAPVMNFEVPARPQFALSTLMLIITLICICLGVATISPGMIIPLIAVVIPALVRTTITTKRMVQRTGGATIEDRVSAFLVSMGVVILTWISGLFTFGAACFIAIQAACAPGSPFRQHEGAILSFGLYGGGLLAIVLMVTVLRVTWPKRK